MSQHGVEVENLQHQSNVSVQEFVSNYVASSLRKIGRGLLRSGLEIEELGEDLRIKNQTEEPPQQMVCLDRQRDGIGLLGLVGQVMGGPHLSVTTLSPLAVRQTIFE